MKIPVLIFIAAILGVRSLANEPIEKITCTEHDDYILTHELTPFGPVPTALDPNGIYPYPSFCETSNRPVLKKYHFIVLENEKLKISICPDLGGKILSVIHKRSGKEVLYVPDIVRYTRILPRFYFVAGGIEVSFPVSHTPVQNEKVLYKIDRTAGRIYVTCGERELRFGMQWSVEYSLGAGDDFLTQRVIYFNPGKAAYPWMSWSNAALPSAPDTEFDFPKGKVLSHSSVIDTIDWEKQGPKGESGIKEMTGYFWKTKDVNAFGAYTPSLGTGLYHIADEKIAPGIKLWSYGLGEDSAWSVLSTARHQQYIEIQGGPLGDQSIKAELQPLEKKWHVEYWIPADRRMDIYALTLPAVQLRSISQIPLFGWARPEEVKVWNALLKAWQSKTILPEPPPVDRNCWAPSGMENLDEAFQWAISNSGAEKAELWKFYYGAWLAGRGAIDPAIKILSTCKTGVSKVLLARLLKSKGNNRDAVAAIESVEEPWLRLHPQIVVERDKLLRSLGPQTYTRTGLWKQITEKLNIPFLPVPVSLGEDRLANFGAYREYE